VLKWMCERVDGKAAAKETPAGYLPTEDALDLTGLDIPAEDLATLLTVDKEAWKAVEVPSIETHFAQFGDRLPKRLAKQFENLKERLGAN